MSLFRKRKRTIVYSQEQLELQQAKNDLQKIALKLKITADELGTTLQNMRSQVNLKRENDLNEIGGKY